MPIRKETGVATVLADAVDNLTESLGFFGDVANGDDLVDSDEDSFGAEVGGRDLRLKEPDIENDDLEESDDEDGDLSLGVDAEEGPASGSDEGDKFEESLLLSLLVLFSSTVCALSRGL